MLCATPWLTLLAILRCYKVSIHCNETPCSDHASTKHCTALVSGNVMNEWRYMPAVPIHHATRC